MARREFILVGVAHTDERNSEELPRWIDEPIRHVYHERAEDGSFSNWLKWAMLSPTIALTTFLRTVSDSGYESECERAAHNLAELHNLKGVTGVGMRYADRIRAKPKGETIIEWVFILMLPYFVWLGWSKSPIFGVVSAVWIIVLLFLFGNDMNQQEFPRREDEMVENLLETSPERSEGQEVVVSGEDHLSGVGGRLQARDFSVESVWLNTILQVREED